MRICIRRGAKQIGGTCIEVESQGKRLLLDIGLPLDRPDTAETYLPDVPGLKQEDLSLLGIVLSHPHLDHYGLASLVPKTVTFLIGKAAQAILEASAIFTTYGGTFDNVIELADGVPVQRGPFLITPYQVDHSAYDSYAILVESDGLRLFYTGDLRGHGRKGKLFERLVAHPPQNIDVLLMEGTTIARTETESGFPTETDIENELVDIFRNTSGMPLIWCSGQNIDRIVTVFRACKRSGRQFIVDMYAAEILKATGNPRIPQAHWKEISVYLPRSQKARIIRQKDFDVAKYYRSFRIFEESLAAVSRQSVMLFRPNMRWELEEAGCLDGACLVYSMWDGYLEKEETKPFLAWLHDHGIPMHKCHTSGHASVKDLRRLRNAFASAVVVPIHTEQPASFNTLFENVEMHADGEWWTL